MAKQAPKTNLPEGFVPLTLSRSAGFFLPEKGNSVQGKLMDVIETEDPFKKGSMRFYFKVELTKGDQTKIVDAETKKERIAEEGELIGVDEKGYLRVLRTVEKGTEIFFFCNGQQEKKDAKKGKNPAWLFEVGKVPS